MILLYNLGIFFYHLAIGIASLWNPKAAFWIKGRRNVFERMTAAVNAGSGKLIWMHCASLGEFEQGRPLLEAIKSTYPEYRILLTFFSSSGYEIRKNYPGVDYIFYLPDDSAANAKKLIEISQPVLAIFVKYEFWHYYLNQLRKSYIPTLLLSATFRGNQTFFKPWGGFWKRILECFQVIFVQDINSEGLLNKLGFKGRIILSGDTRFDRVLEIASGNAGLPLIEKFCEDKKVIVAGSTWLEDEEVMDHFAKSNPEIKFVIAPHEIAESRLKEVEKLFVNTIRFSDWQKNPELPAENAPNVLIIDNIGMLSKLYLYADITYIGGAFGGDGIHNVLEAVVYSKPVVFGPAYDHFHEAVELVDLGAAETVENALELENVFNSLLQNDQIRADKGRIAGNYVREKAGATKIVMNYIQENRLLTS